MQEANELPRPFGDYTLMRRIAVGGMAEVYVAKTNGLGGFEKLVALKLIHPRFSEDEHFVRMLIEEAKVSSLLTHVNIGQTLHLGKVDRTHYIAMELIEGADAYRVMRKCAELKKAIPIEIAVFIAHEVCAALDYAHRKVDPATGKALHIIHRDISPQNVLVSFHGEVKIVDFGIAKVASRSTQTEVGVIKGKYYYMSPEQAWGDPLDVRTDVFSTGVVLYELLTGRMLYVDADVPTLLDKVRKADIPRPETRRATIPRELGDIVMRALAKHPEDRYPSAAAFGQALNDYLYTAYPTFSATRAAALLGLLFPEEGARSQATKLGPAGSSGQVTAELTGEDDRTEQTDDIAQYVARKTAEARAVDPAPQVPEFEDATAVEGARRRSTRELPPDPTNKSFEGWRAPKELPPERLAEDPPGHTPGRPQRIGERLGSARDVATPDDEAPTILKPGAPRAPVEAPRPPAVYEFDDADEPPPRRAWGVLGALGIVTLGAFAVGGYYALRLGEPMGIELRSTPPGATVRVDGTERGRTPIRVPTGAVAGGPVEVTIELPGYQPRRVQLTPSAPFATAEVVLSPEFCTLRVTASPADARVVVRGAAQTAPATVEFLHLGETLVVEVQAPGFVTETERVVVDERQETLHVDLARVPPPPPRRR